MFRVMITTLDNGEEPSCIGEDFISERKAQEWWDENSDQFPEMTGVWIELVSGSDEFFQGWDESEAINAWDGES